MRPVSEYANSDLKAAFRQALKEETVCLLAGVGLAPADKARLEELRAEMKRRDLHLEEHEPRDRWPKRRD